jgi:bifunctional non-homologous end joining protein LigD
MSEALHEYNRKRNFEATPEPSGSARKGKRGDSGHALQFCIQKHDASHLHYDFRLELDGSMKSWAVPKGPSLDPKVKRLAVHVEDHPLDYASFEGHIPEGHYGAGDVIVWDRGVWVPEGDPQEAYAKGKLKFTLQGEKLGGLWNLVRTHMPGRKEQWFLIKHQDSEARPAADYDVLEAEPDSVLSDRTLVPKVRGKGAKAQSAEGAKPASAASTAKAPRPKAKASEAAASAKPIAKAPATPRRTRATQLVGAKEAPLPSSLKPELATLVDSAPSGDWRYEIKFDGYRVMARVDGDDVRLFTRNGHDWTAKMPAQARAIAELGLQSAWLDGEMVVANDKGVPDFQALQNAFETERSEQIVYYLFDVPYLNGMDLGEVPVEQRRAALKKLLQDHKAATLRYSDDFDESATSLLHSACQMQMEGLIGKRVGSPYRSKRSQDWVKLKCQHRQEFVVVGYTDPKGSRSGFGALLLGLHDADSGELRYAGKVGTGFSEATLATILVRLKPLATRTKAVVNPPTGAEARGVHWLKPELLAEVAYAEMTREGSVRHSVFHGLREDKPAKDIVEETAAPSAKSQKRAKAKPDQAAQAESPAKADKAKPTAKDKKAKPASKVEKVQPAAKQTAGTKAASSAANQIRITHPDRVIDASSGTTKKQLADYYASVAEWLLPQLHDRPVALVRAPEGIAGELFFQKNAGHLAVDDLIMVDKAEAGQAAMLVNSANALIGAVQMGTVEFHTWNATRADFAHPDRFILDLDPDPALPWKAMVEAAQLTLAVLDELGLTSFLKTSGGKGLHIVVPLKPKADWDSVKDFSHAIVSHMARLLPERFSAVAGPKNRVGKIFIDYLRNGLGATTACAYGARAREGLPVSVPITREEVAQIKSGSQWNIHNLHERLADLAVDPWADFHKSRQSITATQRKRVGMK